VFPRLRPVSVGPSSGGAGASGASCGGADLIGPRLNRFRGSDEQAEDSRVLYDLRRFQMSTTTTAQQITASPNRLLGAVFGVVYLLVGLAGFAVTGGVDFAGTDGKPLIVFEVNPLHNIVHLLVGALLLFGALRGVGPAKSVNTLVGGVYLVVGLVGLFILDSSANILALNGADNVLHLASAILLLGVGLSQDKAAARTV
jgi:hypothetical protein